MYVIVAHDEKCDISILGPVVHQPVRGFENMNSTSARVCTCGGVKIEVDLTLAGNQSGKAIFMHNSATKFVGSSGDA